MSDKLQLVVAPRQTKVYRTKLNQADPLPPLAMKDKAVTFQVRAYQLRFAKGTFRGRGLHLRQNLFLRRV